MPKPSRTACVIAALLARGYSEVTRDPLASAYRIFAISPTHARRIDKRGARIWFNQHWVRVGHSWTFGRPLPRGTYISLVEEGEAILARSKAPPLSSFIQQLEI